MIFLDTSLFYALADKKDTHHTRAKRMFKDLLEKREEWCTHNYIIVETSALIHRRLGFDPAKRFLQESLLFPLVWIDESMHSEAAEYFSRRTRQNISFVDCMSFLLMKQRGITTALAFDADFSKEGFRVIA
ncbi:MAG: putative nucleic acid-binding protein, contains PIN domain [Parcubacteria group bacterium Gr01-1014_29]|nr:MAG: putative nucleic acid-binding protein, contains PIN domain [Parcubacteria group bacterium Gr01-1014_29]